MAFSPNALAKRFGFDGLRKVFLIRDPLLPALMGAMGGILLAEYVRTDPMVLLLAVVALVLVGVLGLQNRVGGRWFERIRTHRSAVYCFLIFGAAFGFGHRLSLAHQYLFPGLGDAEQGRSLRLKVTGVVRTDPRHFEDSDRASFHLETEKIEYKGAIFTGRHRIPARITDAKRVINYGDRIEMTGLLKLTNHARNPGAYSAHQFYKRNPGALVELVSGSVDRFTVLEKGRGNPVFAMGLRSRDWLAEAITSEIGEEDSEAGSIIKAMVLGIRDETNDATREQFRLSGALHLFAVSGLHVGIFCLIIWWLLSWFRLRIEVAVCIIIPIVLFYAVVTGLRPSAVRAAVMIAIIFAGWGALKPTRLLNSLSLAGLLLLAWNSHQLFLPGFQLSFGVLVAIALLTVPLSNLLSRLIPREELMPALLKSRFRRTAEWLAQKGAKAIATSLAAVIGSAPFVIWHFHAITPISVISNLAMIPIAFGIISLGTASSLLSMVHLGKLAGVLNLANLWLAKLAIVVTGWFAQVPGGHLHVATGLDQRLSPDACRITVLDTADGGAATLVETGDSVVFLDCGNERAFAQVVEPLLRLRGKNWVDHLFLTHGDDRHIGSSAKMIERYEVRYLWEGDPGSRARVTKKLAQAVEEGGVWRQTMEEGNEIRINENTSIRIIYPNVRAHQMALADNRGAVVQLLHQGVRVLFLADSGIKTEAWLLENSDQLRSDILIRGWNAEGNFASMEFTQAIAPRVAIASNQTFPVSEKIPDHFREDLQDVGAVLFDQAETGAVIIEIDEKETVIRSYVTDQEIRFNRMR